MFDWKRSALNYLLKYGITSDTLISCDLNRLVGHVRECETSFSSNIQSPLEPVRISRFTPYAPADAHTRSS